MIHKRNMHIVCYTTPQQYIGLRKQKTKNKKLDNTSFQNFSKSIRIILVFTFGSHRDVETFKLLLKISALLVKRRRNAIAFQISILKITPQRLKTLFQHQLGYYLIIFMIASQNITK